MPKIDHGFRQASGDFNFNISNPVSSDPSLFGHAAHRGQVQENLGCQLTIIPSLKNSAPSDTSTQGYGRPVRSLQYHQGFDAGASRSEQPDQPVSAKDFGGYSTTHWYPKRKPGGH